MIFMKGRLEQRLQLIVIREAVKKGGCVPMNIEKLRKRQSEYQRINRVLEEPCPFTWSTPYGGDQRREQEASYKGVSVAHLHEQLVNIHECGPVFAGDLISKYHASACEALGWVRRDHDDRRIATRLGERVAAMPVYECQASFDQNRELYILTGAAREAADMGSILGKLPSFDDPDADIENGLINLKGSLDDLRVLLNEGWY